MIGRLSTLGPLVRRAGLMLMTGAILSAPSALAQPAVSKTAAPPAAVPAPVSSEPGVTTASFGDWSLQCQRLDADGKAGRVCEVSQTIQVSFASASSAWSRPRNDNGSVSDP